MRYVVAWMLIERVRPDSTHHFTDIETKRRAAAFSFEVARYQPPGVVVPAAALVGSSFMISSQ